jgi:hypothetical protein
MVQRVGRLLVFEVFLAITNPEFACKSLLEANPGEQV